MPGKTHGRCRPRHRPSKRFKSEIVDEMVRLYEVENKTMAQIAAIYDCSEKLVYKYLVEEGPIEVTRIHRRFPHHSEAGWDFRGENLAVGRSI